MKKTLTVLMMVLLAAMLIISCDNNAKEPEKKAEAKTYTVTFATGEGGSDIASQSIEEGKTATKPANPTKTDYYFMRWSTTENGATAFDFSTKITGNTTLYAVWKDSFAIGDVGPAGGIIFYDVDADNGNTTNDGLDSKVCGWRYLEAASADLTTKYTWGPSGSSYSTETGIGKGKSNTDKLLAASGDFPAAKACADYSEGGYDDWFLPSKDELGLMYTNLKSEGKGGTWKSSLSDYYWSSSEGNDSGAWAQDFNSGSQDGYYRGNSPYVRPVRSF